MKPKDLGLLSLPLIGGGFKQVEISTIQYLQSDDTITNIFCDKAGKIIAAKNLGHFIEELKGTPVIRLHKSYMVNLAKIVEYKKAFHYLILDSGAEVPVSREMRSKLMEYLKDRSSPNDSVIARLIVNDAKTGQQAFLMYCRDYIIGRKSISKPCDIMIATEDKTMSRNHFKMLANKKNGNIEFTLSIIDPLNKTWVDGIKINAGETFPLRDGSIIKAGKTNIIFNMVVQDIFDFEKTITKTID